MTTQIYATNPELWKSEIEIASKKKKTLPWEGKPLTPITYVHEKDIKQRDTLYNPIL